MSEVVEFFKTVRCQVQLVRMLSDQIKRLRPDNQEFAKRRLDRESRLLREMEKKAREYMDSTALCPEHYSFLLMYYLTGLSLVETAKAIDRCHRQVRRYKWLFEHGKIIKEAKEQNT